LRKITSSILILALIFLVGCSSKTETKNTVTEIYFLNSKSEMEETYNKIAKDYEAEKGVKVKVVTAADGYETTLNSEIEKTDAPTIFQMNGPIGYEAWKNYTLDLKDTKFYSFLADQSLAISDNGGIYGIPYVVEGYGIIYNDAIMQKYFALPNKVITVNNTDEINNFDKLKAVVEDMQANAAELGIKGVFAATSLSAGEQSRWQTHLANIPLFYEFSDIKSAGSPVLAGLEAKEINFNYGTNFKNIFDLYMNNSTVKPALLGSKSVADSMAEFALGQAAMVQNGNWAWNQINEVSGNVVNAADIKFLPIYTGVLGEEKQGLAIGTENYFAINSKVSAEQQQASLEFLEWLFSSEKGKQYVVNELGFISPFNTFSASEKPNDPLAAQVIDWMQKDVISIPWIFAAFPNEDFKNVLGDALLQYAEGNKTWDEVKTTVVESWKKERAK